MVVNYYVLKHRKQNNLKNITFMLTISRHLNFSSARLVTEMVKISNQKTFTKTLLKFCKWYYSMKHWWHNIAFQMDMTMIMHYSTSSFQGLKLYIMYVKCKFYSMNKLSFYNRLMCNSKNVLWAYNNTTCRYAIKKVNSVFVTSINWIKTNYQNEEISNMFSTVWQGGKGKMSKMWTVL